MLKLKLHWQILIAFVIAIILGITIPEHSGYVRWLGDLFLRALKMIIVPLVFSSIVSGVANLGSTSSLGRLGIKTIILLHHNECLCNFNRIVSCGYHKTRRWC